jgi:hypothetical protein
MPGQEHNNLAMGTNNHLLHTLALMTMILAARLQLAVLPVMHQFCFLLLWAPCSYLHAASAAQHSLIIHRCHPQVCLQVPLHLCRTHRLPGLSEPGLSKPCSVRSLGVGVLGELIPPAVRVDHQVAATCKLYRNIYPSPSGPHNCQVGLPR